MNLKSTIKEVIQAILPLAMVIILFQFTSIRIPVEDFYYSYWVSYLLLWGLYYFLLEQESVFCRWERPLGHHWHRMKKSGC